MLPYGLIILFGSIGLIVYFNFGTDASRMAKVITSGFFIFSLAFYLDWLPYMDGRTEIIIGRFLLVGVSIFIIFYRTWERARLDKD